MASEIQGLPDLHGYLKSGNLVVRLSFPYIELPKRHEALIARKLPAQIKEAQQLKEERTLTTTAPGNGDGRFTPVPPPKTPQRVEQVKPPARASNDDLPFLK
jgi:hypothetical protein